MKKIGLGIAAVVVVAGLLPFALIARSRATQKDALPVHLVMDMDKQPKGKAQRATPMFADQRFMRPQAGGTVAREDLGISGQTLNDAGGTRPIFLAGGRTALELNDPVTYAAVVWGRIWPTEADPQDAAKRRPISDAAFIAIPVPNKNEQEIAGDTTFYVRKVPAVFEVSVAMLQRGQERYGVYCATCHGESGYGDGPVAARAAKLQATAAEAASGWVAPQNLQEAKILARPDGHIFNTITNGIRTMPAYDKQIGIEDRWAIVAYVRALERSQNARPGDEGVK